MDAIDKIVDKILDIFFSKDKTKLYVLIFFVIGFVLRLINVMNIPTSVDASGHAIMAINFISSGKLATWNQSVGLWHFLTDLAYKIFGMNDFGARFFVLLFGSFSIILMFLFTKEFFGKRAGLIASFLLAVSPFHISETVPEMDVVTMFFAMFSIFLFVKALKENKRIYFVLSGILIGVATLIKIYSLLFIPALLLYAFYYFKKTSLEKKQFMINIILFFFIAGIFCSVSLIYNYLLYQDKGYLDYIFTGIFGLGKGKSNPYYSWIVPYEHDYANFFLPGAHNKLPFFIYYIKVVGMLDILTILFGIAGMILMLWNEKREYFYFFLCCFFTIYLYMGSIVFLMTKHYMFLLILITPFAGFFLDKISKNRKLSIKILILAILIFQLIWLAKISSGDFYHKSSMNQLVNYKKEIKPNSIVIYDGRIFRGIGAYVFSGTHYLESSLFPELMKIQSNLSEQSVNLEVHFIECVVDDCGWGTIKGQPDFNKSMEEIVDFFKNNSRTKISVYEYDKKYKNLFSYEKIEKYRIYKSELILKPASLNIVDSTHIFWANPVGYDEKIAPVFDNYKTRGLLNGLVNKIAHLIFYISVLVSLVSVFVLLHYFIIENEEIKHINPGI